MNLILVKIPSMEKVMECESSIAEIKLGDDVIVDAGQIIEIGQVIGKKTIDNYDKEKFEISIIRIATTADKQKIKQLNEKSLEYLKSCREKTIKHNLISMNILNAGLSFDEKKVTIYFSAEGRVDFRELVTDLVKTHRKIVRLQQVGARDEAKIMGGCGKCGRDLCCSSFLKDIESVTLDMAKEQEIISSSNKLSGACGKLMCCLMYELEEYRAMSKNLPKVGDIVKTKEGNGRVVSRNILRQKIVIEKEDGQKIEVEK